MKTVLAIDLGATSGRGILYSIENGKLISREVHRFNNSIQKVKGRLCWDIESLVKVLKMYQNFSRTVRIIFCWN